MNLLAYSIMLALASAIIVRMMISLGRLDHPTARSSHVTPTAKGGGVGIVAAFVVGLGIVELTGGLGRGLNPHFYALIGATSLIALISYGDDVRNWPFTVKLAAQLAASLIFIASGACLNIVHLPIIGRVDLGWLGLPLTAFWMVAATNAVNFIDGLNGLASGTVAIACVCLAAIACSQNDNFVEIAALSLAAGIAGFLPFNFPKARIFMGDVGSQPCGFVLSALGVLAANFGEDTLSVLLIPLALFAVLFDVAFTLVRRMATGQKLTDAHRGHLYQVAQRAGMPAIWVTALYWAMAAWGGLCCVGFTFMGIAEPSGRTLVASALLPPFFWLLATTVLARRAKLSKW